MCQEPTEHRFLNFICGKHRNSVSDSEGFAAAIMAVIHSVIPRGTAIWRGTPVNTSHPLDVLKTCEWWFTMGRILRRHLHLGVAPKILLDGFRDD